MKTTYLLQIIMVFSIVSLAFGKPLTAIPAHPDKIKYSNLNWEVPLGEPYRQVLDNGLKVYIATDSSLPLYQISGFIQCGTLLDPEGKEGLTSLMTTMLLSGGTKKYNPDTLDKLIDQLALKFSFNSGKGSVTFSLSFLSEFQDSAFDIMEQVFFHPEFDQKKLDKTKSIYIESIRHRFDNPGPTLDAAYQKTMYASSTAGRFTTEKSIQSITRDDLIQFHKSYFLTNNIILSIAGNFDKNTITKKLEKIFPKSNKSPAVIFPEITNKSDLKTLIIHKPISQMYVRIGLPLFKRPNDDYYAMSLLNMILGDGGFASRLVTKIRSDEGLTYSIHSVTESNYTYPGTFYISFFTKIASFSRACELTLKEVEKILDSSVTAKELADAKSGLIGELPSMFRSPYDIVSTYAWNEYFGRSPDHFKKYESELNKISRDDILRVAKKYLKMDQMTFTVVGDSSAILKSGTPQFNISNLKPQKVITAEQIVNLP
jgi:predicted Zn-dependent peptidase